MEVFYIVCAVLFLSTYTLAQVPAPRDVVARAHTLNKVSLTWRDPDLPEGAMTPPSGRIYRISYRATHPWQTSFQEVEADEAWASVNNLSPFTRYEFLVTIEQDGRRGSQSEATAVTTVVIGARGAPTSTASINKVEEYGGVTGVNVLVRWTTKDDPDNEYTGHIIFYTHSEAPEFKESYMSWAIKRMDGKDNRAVIEELNPESMYGFLVQPFNANGGGPVSMIYWYTTPKRDAGGIVRPGGLGIGEKATNRKCPPGVRQVKCAVDPCENTQCSHYRCEPNYCGRCSAVYFDVFGNEAQCESQATLHGCAPNVQLSQCEVDPCEESTCPKYPNALCRANYCGGCFADFYDIYGSKIEDCRLGGDTELDEYYGCPPDVPVVACKLDPCLVSTCPRYPRARCKFTFCGECKAEFYNNDGAIVDCGNTDTGAECPPGVPVVSCIINPCQDARCPADRTAVCKENYCGGCIAEFFDTSGNKVNCEVEEKPGTCPVVQDSSEAVGLCVELCISDSDCAGSDKCCSNGCGHVCRPPKKVEKEGSCPATDVAYGFIGYCAEYCSLDDDCPGEQKCCSNGCGHVCIPPAEEPNVKEKPGNCPASTSVLGGICAEMCNIDQDCPDDQKCCSNGCGHDCMSPVTTGLCESVRDLCLGGRCINTASGGYTCICPAGTQLSRERTSCEEIRQPESEPPCHTELRAVPYPYPLGIFLPSCRDDGYYEKHQCHTSTGYCWCSSKEGVEVDGTRVRGEAKCDKDGECPARKPGEFGACVEACTYDHDCPGTSKCCSNGCGLSCVEIETETEELDQPPCHAELRAIQQPYPPGTFLPSCREDGYYEKHQCYTSTGYCWCASKDGTEVDGTRVRGSANCDKPGTCPAVQSGLVGTCVEECSYDYDCADSKKCCYNGCGHTCVAIESEPQRDETPCYSEVRSIPYPYAPGVLVPRCRGDGYYEKEQCHASTGQCWCVNVNGEEADGTRVSGRATCDKAGTCPAPQPGTVATCDEACSYDYDCAHNEKCCSNGCGNTCIVVQTEKLGTCPSVAPGSVGTCVDYCQSDFDCADNDKCCSNGCGHSCVAMQDNTNPGGRGGYQLSDEPPCMVELRDTEINSTPGMFKPRCNEAGFYTNEQCWESNNICWCVTKMGNEVDGTRVRGSADCDKPGSCPAVTDDTVGTCVEECSYDHDCFDDQKCCSNGCGHTCVTIPEPKSEEDNRESSNEPCNDDLREAYNVPGSFLPRCTADGFYEKEQCWHETRECWCVNRFGTEVSGTRKEGRANCDKSGECPAVEDNGLVCDDECSYDYDCSEDSKCCSNGCGRACMVMPQVEVRPVEKAGECPVVADGVVGTCAEYCSNDGDCGGDHKCCTNGCGHTCVAPARVEKPGECPVVADGLVGTCAEYCSNDGDCGGDHKCCSNGCGHTCVAPARVEKPGECPVVADGLVGTCAEYCSNDGDCGGDHKCCSNGCGHTCVAPARVEKPGECPVVADGLVGTCAEYCSNDGDCGGDHKCCSNGCGHTCVAPAKPRPVEKPGECPVVADGVVGTCAEYCFNDGDCGGDHKCCSNGCGHTCVAPARARPVEKPGECPVVADGVVGTCAEYCSNDGDCGGDHKCCSNGCGHTCVAPARARPVEKPGECPVVADGVVGTCAEYCSNDGDCGGDHKCCSNGCGHTCVAPARVEKPGECPVVADGLVGTCAEYCSNDGDCGGDHKCCSNGCGHTCVAPARVEKPGECPVVADGLVGTCAEYCSNDGDCGGDHKCCSNGCGHTCVAPAKPRPVEKPGECPVVADGVVGTCAEYCFNDGDCGGDHKCCSNGCGHTCVAPARVEKPGECPVVADGVVGTCAEYCSNDGDCGGDHKCCSNGCGHTCVAPARARPVEKPGECPVVADGVVGTCAEYCSNDGDCGGDHKCCSNGCGHTCVAPAKPRPVEKPGECPVVADGVVGTCAEYCSNDGDCGGDHKCCSNGCGHTCVAPAKPRPVEKPGECPVVADGVVGTCAEYCSNDGDCGGDHKCCSNGCGRTCVAPARVRPVEKKGECPVVEEGTFGICSDYCSNDGDCGGDHKCCSNGCGHTCVAPERDEPEQKPGICPAAPEAIAGFCADFCDSDMACFGDEKCCSTGCGHVCLAPVKEKEGTCPAVRPGVAGVCTEFCSTDNDCNGKFKCCSNGCGHVCVPPFSLGGGIGGGVDKSEPPCHKELRVVESRGKLLGAFKPRCTDEGYYEKKQCWGSTGHCWCTNKHGEEVDGTRTRGSLDCDKLGTCPAVSNDAVGICVESCSYDHDCPGNDKCCSNGCGHVCRPADLEKEGTCPVIQSGSGGICVQECAHDYECEGDNKCCSNGCGNVCSQIQDDTPLEPPCRADVLKAYADYTEETFIPYCDDDGYYLSEQCWHTSGECWCTDRYGNELTGSRTNGRANCT